MLNIYIIYISLCRIRATVDTVIVVTKNSKVSPSINKVPLQKHWNAHVLFLFLLSNVLQLRTLLQSNNHALAIPLISSTLSLTSLRGLNKGFPINSCLHYYIFSVGRNSFCGRWWCRFPDSEKCNFGNRCKMAAVLLFKQVSLGPFHIY